MLENIIITLIVFVCAVYVGRKFYRQFKGTETGCGCSCTGCDVQGAPPKDEHAPLKTVNPQQGGGCECSFPKEKQH